MQHIPRFCFSKVRRRQSRAHSVVRVDLNGQVTIGVQKFQQQRKSRSQCRWQGIVVDSLPDLLANQVGSVSDH